MDKGNDLRYPHGLENTGQSKSIPRFEIQYFKTEGGLGPTLGKYKFTNSSSKFVIYVYYVSNKSIIVFHTDMGLKMCRMTGKV